MSEASRWNRVSLFWNAIRRRSNPGMKGLKRGTALRRDFFPVAPLGLISLEFRLEEGISRKDGTDEGRLRRKRRLRLRRRREKNIRSDSFILLFPSWHNSVLPVVSFGPTSSSWNVRVSTGMELTGPTKFSTQGLVGESLRVSSRRKRVNHHSQSARNRLQSLRNGQKEQICVEESAVRYAITFSFFRLP